LPYGRRGVFGAREFRRFAYWILDIQRNNAVLYATLR